MLLPLSSSFTSSLPGWLYQGHGVPLGACGMHPERCISVLSHWNLWVWGWFGGRRMGQWLWVLTSCWWPQGQTPRADPSGSVPWVSVPSKGLHLAKSLLPEFDLQGGAWFGELSPSGRKGVPGRLGAQCERTVLPCWWASATPQGWVQLTSPSPFQGVLEGKAQWKAICHIINFCFGEIFLSTEQTLQVTHLFNGVYYFIIAACYNGQLKHDKQKQQKCDVVDDQISFPYICFVNLHSSTLCFLWWAAIKAWNSCLPTLPSHVNFALGMSLLQAAFLIMVPEHHLHREEHTE